jgi:hypothetical protein
MGISHRSQDDEAVEHRFDNAYGPETKRHRAMPPKRRLSFGVFWGGIDSHSDVGPAARREACPNESGQALCRVDWKHRWTQGMSLQKLLTLGIQSATIMKASRMLTRAHRALVLTLRFHQVRIMTAPGNTVLVLMLRIVSRYTQLI